ncbi:MAG: DNA mismatch repair endonuclease MutL [Lachnospirales bacterium]
MAKIQVLDNNLINKIAAGEVVERPLNVVKELVENSLDAKATQINVEIKNGGLTYILVADNGTGIERDYIKTAFLRHATSKIEKIDDLSSILTLGFRGEALSSISSVSEVIVTTKTKDDELAIELTIVNGEIISEKQVKGDIGTTFIVKNLFFNVPARLKFLKKPVVEGGYVSDLLQNFALSSPDVKFNYFVNGVRTLFTMGDGFKKAVYNIYGKEISNNSIFVEDSSNDYLGFKGIIGLPSISRGNKKYINFFINGRVVKSEILTEAVIEAYKTSMMVGRFPFCALSLTIDPEYIDVNVHPTKIEVRFTNEDMIYDLTLNFVKKALLQGENNLSDTSKLQNKKDFVKPIFENNETEFKEVKLNLNEPLHKEEYKGNKNNYEIPDIALDFESEIYLKEDFSEEKEKPSLADLLYNNDKKENIDYKKDFDKFKKENFEKQEIKEEVFVPKYKHTYKIIGQVFKSYWLLEKDDNMFLLDQHAGHERLIYEKYKRELKNAKVVSQQTFDPKTVVVSFSESFFIRKNIDNFSRLGFEIEEFGENIFAIRAFPLIFDKVTDVSFFYEILSDFKKGENLYDFSEEVVIMKSCKSAIKANTVLEYVEAKKLVDDILNEQLTHCPHGRPIFVTLSKKDIEKMFKRI